MMPAASGIPSGPVTLPENAIGLACLLSLSGGFLDAFTYNGYGHVFANAMTANIVLLGVSVAAEEWRRAFNYIPPIIAFLAGVLVGQAIRLPSREALAGPPC
jgi:uncharacterized membrane protein YoaK (UPF0700 family)